MDIFGGLLAGFANILTPENLLFAFIGCALGMLTGVIPGFGPASATSLLLPLALFLGPAPSTIMMAAIYYGSMYGGTITSVLLNVPGEISSVATTLDGYAMTKRGQGGKALAISAIGSFIGGTIAFVGLVFATNLSSFAVGLGPRELFAITIFALVLVIGLAGDSLVKGLIAACIGLFVGFVGLDPFTGITRFTAGNLNLADGISFVIVAIGVIGLSEILESIGRRTLIDFSGNVGPIRITWKDLKDSSGAIFRGTGLGFFYGLLPGSPAAAATFTSYAIEKRLSKHPERFGKGAIQGVAGPETTNNALGMSNYIPLLTLGIPSSTTMAILLGAFTINGLQPGPQLFAQHPEVAWTLIASLFVANIMLFIMSLPLVRVWVSFLKIPTLILYSATLGFMTIGAYSVRNSMFDVLVMWIGGLAGLLMKRLGFPLAPLALTLVLGPLLEENFRRAVSIEQGNYGGLLFSSTVCQVIYGLIVVLLLVKVFTTIRASSKKAGARTGSAEPVRAKEGQK
ncbi:MAG: hypothetical protein JWR04_1686 [Rhodoglobus sp.]|jgi:putative tricarboxylic transport membrane protein|nr:hypothetical protein [Rhodoglobus sp.]